MSKNDKKLRPAIINTYNFTNGGTDIQDQRMGTYTTSSKSKRFTRKVLSYLLDTARVNAQTIYYLILMKIPRESNSFDFAMDLIVELVTPLVESRPLKGLQDDIINKMGLFLNRIIDKTKETAALDATPLVPPKNVTTRAQAVESTSAIQAVPNVGPGPSLPRPKAIKFGNSGTKRRCNPCNQAISGKGKKKFKQNLTKNKWQCSICSKPVCKDHFHSVCFQCANSHIGENQDELDRQAMQD